MLEYSTDEKLFAFTEAKKTINSIIASRKLCVEDAELRRRQRYVELDVEALRQKGDILEDETFIPVRVIDSNIMREKPDALAFLNANNRLAIFHPTKNPNINPRNLEFEFTKVLTYEGWDTTFNKVIDGSKLHGWDAVEVVFDSTKPGHVAFEHVGFDKLFFAEGISNIQDSPVVLREYPDVTHMNLYDFVKNNGFDSLQVDLICQKDKDKPEQKTCKIYKYLVKNQGIVFVGWFSLDGACTDWLKAPQPLQLGIYDPASLQESPVDKYPIFLNIDKEDEQDSIDKKKGRGFLDWPAQEATTALTTAFVNGTTRASNIFASPEEGDDSGADLKQLELQLVPGGFYNKPCKFWSPPFPDVGLLSGLNFLQTLNAAQTGKPAAAVSNRKDSRKTAQELKQASAEEAEISGIGQMTFSSFLRGVFSFAWLIVQSQAVTQKIDFLKIEQQNELGMSNFVNDIATIAESYDVRPAGDVDIIEAEQEAQKIQQDWPVVQVIPGLREAMLERLLRLRYPKQAESYIAAMKAGDPGKNLVQSMGTLLQATMSPEELKALPPEEQQQLQVIQQQAQAYLQS